MQVRSVHDVASVQGLHVLFIGRAASAQLDRWIAVAQEHAVLTVTEEDGGGPQRGAINFMLIEGRVRFTVFLPAAERAGIKLSSRLLAVAHRVDRGPA